MATPPRHRRIIMFGTLIQATGGGSEIFEFGFAAATPLSDQQAAQAVLEVIQPAWTNQTNNFSSAAQLDGVRCETIDGNGKVESSYAVEGTHPIGTNIGAKATILSQAITLETSTPNAHGNTVRGRFYPPAYGSPQGSTVELQVAEAVAQIWQGILNGCIAAGVVPAVASSVGAGALAQVTAVSCDTIIDTIRRRKNHVTGQRSTKRALNSP